MIVSRTGRPRRSSLSMPPRPARRAPRTHGGKGPWLQRQVTWVRIVGRDHAWTQPSEAGCWSQGWSRGLRDTLVTTGDFCLWPFLALLPWRGGRGGAVCSRRPTLPAASCAGGPRAGPAPPPSRPPAPRHYGSVPADWVPAGSWARAGTLVPGCSAVGCHLTLGLPWIRRGAAEPGGPREGVLQPPAQ